METIKAYTDLEQSKVLAEILPIESADACWTNHLFSDFLSSWRIESTPPQEYKCLLDRFVVKGYLIEPAWSLTALLNLIPDSIYENTDDFAQLEITKKSVGYHDINDNIVIGTLADNLVDACYKMILKLHELNLL